MADDLARRREIRKRKILEGSEARLKKITSCSIKKSQENDSVSHGDYDEIDVTPNTNDRNHEGIGENNSKLYGGEHSKFEDDDVPVFEYDITPGEKYGCSDQPNLCRGKQVDSDSQSSLSANGDFTRSCSPDYYTFPKKVSDAETRSFGRTRSDVRRNSSCTQIMMETLQFSFSLTFLRFCLAAVAAFSVKAYFLFSRNVPIFKTIFIPFVLLEVPLYSWSKFEAQVCSRPMVSSLISGVLLLCGLPSTVASSFNAVWNTIQSFIVDLCVYLFSFVFFHFISEMCM